MNVGILTFHYSNNAGAVLQAYGLSQAIRDLGHDVKIIDYRPLAARRAVDGHWLRNPISLLRHPAGYLRKTAVRRAFNRFRETGLPLTRTYLTWGKLRPAPPQFDGLVCGSDQVWNIAGARGFDPAFFLDFSPETGLRRVSYAATFGHAENLGSHRERIRELLSCFDALSVRDEKSRRMVAELTGRPPLHVLDPSFLANYDSITPPPAVEPPYVFLYCFDAGPLTLAAVGALRDRLKLPIVSTSMPDIAGVKAVPFGPLSWLGLIRNAGFVCTNSFHGVCFSIANRKPFVVLPYPGRMSRIEDVLDTAGLADRIVTEPGALASVLSRPIDYGPVCERMASARQRSLTFLRDALQ